MTNRKHPPSRRNSTTKFLDPEVLHEAASAVANDAKRAGVRAALLGGLAMQCYESDRLTGDVDLVVDAPVPGYEGEPLSFGGIKTFAPNGAPTDLILRDDKYKKLYLDALYAARRVEDVSMPVVTPEYLAAMKMAANRTKDQLDLECLINTGHMDLAKARKIVGKYLGAYAEDEFDSAVMEAEFMRSRKK